MISSIIATLLTTKLKKESIYTLKLIRRGIDLFKGREALLDLVADRPNTQFYVVDAKQKFLGVDRDDVADLLIAMDLINPDIPKVKPEDDLDMVMKLFGMYDYDELPVVDSNNPDMVIGAIKHKEVIEAYNREVMKRNLSQEIPSSVKLLERIKKVDFIDGYIMAEIPVPESFIDRTIKDINIGSRFGVQILLIKRPSSELEVKQLVPSADEKIMSGDWLVVLGSDEDIDTLRHVYSPLKIQIVRQPGVQLPRYMTEHAAGMDIHAAAAEDIIIKPGERALVLSPSLQDMKLRFAPEAAWQSGTG